MDLPSELSIIHQPVRLKVMTLLYRQGDIGFAEAHEHLGLTPGNLEAHGRRLAEAGLMQPRRAFMKGRFEVRWRITPDGTRLFSAYLEWLRQFLSAAQTQAAGADEGT